MNNDLISRESLKKAFKAWKEMDDYYHNTDCNNIPFSEAFDLIDNAPTVYPICEDKACKYRVNERPQGEWIVDEDNVFHNFMKCSICNEGAEWLDGGSQFLSNYCPNCGAQMVGGSK